MTVSFRSDGVRFNDGTVLSGIFPSNGRSMGENGYQKFPSGIIYQWGTWNGTLIGQGANGGYITFAAPLKFPNTTLQLVAVGGFSVFSGVFGTIYNSDDNTVISTSWTNNATQTLFTLNLDGMGGGQRPPQVTKIHWFAIGH